jgi:hypothetical protein
MPERLLRVIVCGRYTGVPEESEEKSLFGAYKIGSEGFGRFEAKRLFTDGIELPDEAFLDLTRKRGRWF